MVTDGQMAAQVSAFLPLLERAVDAVLDAPCTSTGTALAELSLSLGLVEERLVALVRAEAAGQSCSGLVRPLVDAGESHAGDDLSGEIAALLTRLRADASAAVPPGQVGAAAPRATVAAVANMLLRRGGAKDNNNTAV